MENEKTVYTFDPKNDFVPWFSKKIDLMRLHPECFIFMRLLPRVGETIDTSGPLGAQKTPLLKLLYGDFRVFKTTDIKLVMHGQLFILDPIKEKIFPAQGNKDRAFGQAFEYHKKQLIAALPYVDIKDVLQKRLPYVKTIVAIKKILGQLKGKTDLEKKTIKGLRAALVMLDANKVINLFKTLTDDTTAFEKQVKDIIERELKANVFAIGLTEVLKQVSEEYKKQPKGNKQFMGEFMYNKIKQKFEEIKKGKTQKEQEVVARKFGAIEKKFMNMYRMPQDIRSVFSGYIKSADELKKLAPIESFYVWIEPYGLLLKILNDWVGVVKAKLTDPASKQLELLVSSLAILI